MDLEQRLYDLGFGKVDWKTFLAEFQKLPMKVPVKAPTANWGEVYRRAEEGPGNDDVPFQLNAAKTAGQISGQQFDQLIGIYRQKVNQGPATAPAG